MEFWTTILGLVRRKRVIIPAVLIATAWGAAAYLGTPVRYESSTTMVLTTTAFGGTESQDPANPTELTNPMLNFNESLRTTSAILIQAMNTKAVATQLGARGPTQLIVNDGRTNPDLLGLNGPFLYIVAESTSPEEAERVVLGAQALMREQLHDWQSALNAPQKTYVSLVDVVSPTTPEPQRARATKLGLIAFIFGFLLCLGGAYLAHQIRARRLARAAAARVVATEEAEPAATATTPRKKAQPATATTPRKKAQPATATTPRKKAQPATATTPRKKAQPATAASTSRSEPTPVAVPAPRNGQVRSVVVGVPVKTNVRARNR